MSFYPHQTEKVGYEGIYDRMFVIIDKPSKIYDYMIL